MTSRKLKSLCTTNLWKSDPKLSPEAVISGKKTGGEPCMVLPPVFFLTSRVIPCSARCPKRPNCLRYFPAALARSSLVLWRVEPPPEKSMGLCAPNPQQVKDLHHAEIAYRNFPYAVGPPMLRRNGCGFLP
jgi:hypothetical protein